MNKMFFSVLTILCLSVCSKSKYQQLDVIFIMLILARWLFDSGFVFCICQSSALLQYALYLCSKWKAGESSDLCWSLSKCCQVISASQTKPVIRLCTLLMKL